MKIAFVYDAVYPWVKGGAERRIYELGKRLSAKGHEVHIFGIKWWEGEDTIEHEGMTLHGVCKAMELYINGKRSISEALIFSVKLFSHLKREKMDLIDVSVFPYFPCFTTTIISILKKTPSVFTWHEVWGDYWYEYFGKIGFFGKVIEKSVSKISVKNIAVSDWTKKRLETLQVPEEKISVIPNGIDLEMINGIESEGGITYAGLDRKIYDVIFVGRLIKEKNVDALVKAVVLLKVDFPDIRCCIVGEGPEKADLMELVKELKVCENFEFVGFQEYSALIGKVKASKVLVLPSSREGFGMIVIEAFACGVPVVTVEERYNAAQELVDDGIDGFVVKLDADEIKVGIKKIIQEDIDYKKTVESAFCEAKKYDWNEIVTKILITYQK